MYIARRSPSGVWPARSLRARRSPLRASTRDPKASVNGVKRPSRRWSRLLMCFEGGERLDLNEIDLYPSWILRKQL